ncbi:alpha-(1,3)-fucosyltransferase C-like [Achroia grisella]|uniref:alpha-(1,3)-fucosyltransferase C-like n=1 Tax=Achroia grisella TaxID=688607 RepID=UPI0027D29E96|nr:alpha-(1,3)-fucosyltransferase C-like [Achroia grisella]
MARIGKSSKLIIHLICLIILSYMVSQRSIKTFRSKKVIRFLPDLKYILVWTSFYGIVEDGQEAFVKRECSFKNCYITHNRNLFSDLRYFDVILFNGQDLSGKGGDLPVTRSVMQKYIFAINDSADNYPVCNPVYDDFFNWTWTYRLESTIPYKFITVNNKHDQELGSNINWRQNMTPINNQLRMQLDTKFKAAAIFLDKCESRSKRELFLKKLQYHLSKYNLTVDVFGECGSMRCKRNTMTPCYYRLRKNYFFYLALEDSIAIDYITKDILNAYKNNAVPIVFGGAYYEQFLPPNSYINGLTMGEETLAKIMNDIVKNRERYYQFFKWKNHYTITESPVLNLCSLCASLNNHVWLTHRMSFSKFRKWWNPSYTNRCSTSGEI